MQAIDDLREEEKVDLDRLEEIDEFIIEMKEKFERYWRIIWKQI